MANDWIEKIFRNVELFSSIHFALFRFTIEITSFVILFDLFKDTEVQDLIWPEMNGKKPDLPKLTCSQSTNTWKFQFYFFDYFSPTRIKCLLSKILKPFCLCSLFLTIQRDKQTKNRCTNKQKDKCEQAEKNKRQTDIKKTGNRKIVKETTRKTER